MSDALYLGFKAPSRNVVFRSDIFEIWVPEQRFIYFVTESQLEGFVKAEIKEMKNINALWMTLRLPCTVSVQHVYINNL